MQHVDIRGAIKQGKPEAEQPLEEAHKEKRKKVTGKSWENNILAWGDRVI